MTKATFLEKRLESVKTFLADFKTPITASLIAGLLSYIFIFTNKLPNHDDAFMMFNKGIGLESGRWGLSILSMIFPDFSGDFSLFRCFVPVIYEGHRKVCCLLF